MPKKKEPPKMREVGLMRLLIQGKLEAHYDIRRLTGRGQTKIKGKTDPDYGDEN